MTPIKRGGEKEIKIIKLQTLPFSTIYHEQ